MYIFCFMEICLELLLIDVNTLKMFIFHTLYTIHDKKIKFDTSNKKLNTNF